MTYLVARCTRSKDVSSNAGDVQDCSHAVFRFEHERQKGSGDEVNALDVDFL